MLSYIRNLIKYVDAISIYAVVLSGVSISIILLIEVVNALGRKVGMPFPCTLEMAESLMISCIFMATSAVASAEDHTFVTVITRKLPGSTRRSLDAFANFLGAIVIAILAVGAWDIALSSVAELEMRIGVYRFPIYPFKIIFAIGLSLLSLQFLVNVLRCILNIKDKIFTSD